MKECPVCNTQNNDEANVCMECGTRFEGAVQNSDNMVNNANSQEAKEYNIPQNASNNNIKEFQNTSPTVNTNQYQQNTTQFNNPNQFQQNQNYHQFNNANQYQQQGNVPLNKKSKAVGLILNILLVGLGYAYVGKWGEGIVLAVIYIILLTFSVLIVPFILAVLLWIYSLFKTNQMIDNYNQGLPY